MRRLATLFFALAAPVVVLNALVSCAGSANAAPSAPASLTPISPTYVDNANGVLCYLVGLQSGGGLSCVKVR